MTMMYGQLVIGPPGSGKTSYCQSMSQFLKDIGRKVAIINLDPANDMLPYEANIDISNLITVEDVMKSHGKGPNGGLIHCMEFLEQNIVWLIEELNKFSDCYFLFDCPGQVELYTHHQSLQNIISILSKPSTEFRHLLKSPFSLCAVHLVDSHYCCDPSKFISVVLTSRTTMLQIALPQINVLSKADLIEKHGKLHFNLEFYTKVLDPQQLADLLSDDPFLVKYKKLNDALVQLLDGYPYVHFHLLTLNSRDVMSKVLKAADEGNGYVFGINEENRNMQNLLSSAMSSDFEYSQIADIQEKYVSMEPDHVKNYVSHGR